MHGFARTVDHTIAKSSREFKSVNRGYRLLLVQSGLVVALALLYIGLTSWVVFDNDTVSRLHLALVALVTLPQALGHPGNLAFIYTICFISATLAELALCLLILYRTLQPVLRRNKKQTSQTISEGITIEVSIYLSILASLTRTTDRGIGRDRPRRQQRAYGLQLGRAEA